MRSRFWRRLSGIALAIGLGFFPLGSCKQSQSPTAPEDPSGPVIFDIGTNDPTAVVAFGDSISDGKDSTDGLGYRKILEQRFAGGGRPYLRVLNESIPGSFTFDGAARIAEVLSRDRPAVLILLYGTNDEARGLPQYAFSNQALPTTQYLRTIIQTARANKTLVLLSTLPPTCGWTRRNQLANIITMNQKIRALALELSASDLGVFSADLWMDFLSNAPPDGCALIGESGNHPTDAGYALMAESYYNVLRNVAW